MPRGSGVNFQNAILSAAMAAQLARAPGGRGRPKSIGPRLPGGAFHSKNAAKVLARAANRRPQRKRNPMVPSPVKSAQGGLPSFSSWGAKHKPSKRVLAMKRVGAPNFRVSNFGFQLQSVEGFQAATNFAYAGIDFLRDIQAQVPNTTAPAVAQFVLESFRGEFLMTNSSLATQYVDIYDIVRKRDTQAAGGPNAVWPTLDPVNAWKYGVSDQSTAPPDLTAYENINSKPTDSRLFNDYFKIAKRTRIGLVAGATHRHLVTMISNKLIDTELLNKAQGDLAGLTTYTMVVINGQPASISSESGAVVTTAKTALDIVWATRCKYTFVVDNKVLWSVQDNLSSLKGEKITQPSLGAFVDNDVF